MSTDKQKSYDYAPTGVTIARRRGELGFGVDPDAVPNLAGRTALIVGRSSLDMRQFSIWVEQFGGLGVSTQQPVAALRWLEQRQSALPFVIFDSDDFDDMNDVVTFGFDLRKAAPHAPIIMLSSQIRRNDFTSERMMICDATLKSPVTLTAFCLGLEAALANHVYYLTAVRAVHHG